MKAFIGTVEALSRLGGYAAMVLFALAMLVVCQMIFMRYVLSASTIWQTEFVIYAIVAATYLGSARVLMLKGHVGVDLVPNMVGRRTRFGLEMIGAIVSLGFLCLLAWSGWLYLYEAWEGGWRTDTVWAPPLWIPLLPLPVGIGLLCLQYVADVLKLLYVEGNDPDDMTAGDAPWAR
jgi:TRAP-type C4-dicarboxylate transport system permease small subunit